MTLIIPDASDDLRFRDNSYVTSTPKVRFYDVVPIIAPGGHVLGSIAVIDFEPRVLPTSQIAGLEILAEQVMAKLEASSLSDTNRQSTAKT